MISDYQTSCCQRLWQEGCERKAVTVSKNVRAASHSHHTSAAAANSGGPTYPTFPLLLFGECKDEERTDFVFGSLTVPNCIVSLLLICCLTIWLSTGRQHALTVYFEEVQFRQLYVATFNDELVVLLLTIG